jgi:hypothetical protein
VRNLEELVALYIRRDRPKLEAQLASYRNKPTLSAAIQDAAFAVTEKGGKHRHQWRISDDVLEKAATSLLKYAAEIQACDTFSVLLPTVEKRKGVKGFGRLAVYDTALRIGAFRRVYPDKVYLHSGTRKGWKALGFDGNRDTVPVDDVPEALRVLAPHEVEDFLCIYKARLRGETVGAGCGWEASGRGCGG